MVGVFNAELALRYYVQHASHDDSLLCLQMLQNMSKR